MTAASHRRSVQLLFAGLLFASCREGAGASAPETRRMLGSIPFDSCSLTTPGFTQTVEAFCGELQVPEDRTHPERRTLRLALGWLMAAKETGARREPIVLLAGGPGQSARAMALLADLVLEEAGRDHHILLLDQRGTGASNPLHCEAFERELDSDTSSLERASELAQSCVSGLEADVRHYTTAQAADDLEALRRAIDAPQLHLVGVSYGTRLAQEYARRYPTSVRTMTLDGVVPPSLVLGERFGVGLDAALEQSLAACAPGTPCRSKLGDPLANLDAALSNLRRQPVSVSAADPRTGELRTMRLDAEGFIRLIHTAAYRPLWVAALPQLLKDARDGRWDLLVAQRTLLLEQDLALSMVLHFSVACAEDAPRLGTPSPAEERSRAGSMFHREYLKLCQAWPSRAPTPPLALESDTPTLLLSGQFDHVTPPSGAEEVAKGLSHSKHVVLAGQGHNVFGTGCVPRLIARFIKAGAVEGLDTTCANQVAALPPFSSRAGWEP